jgi:hypothetical protein
VSIMRQTGRSLNFGCAYERQTPGPLESWPTSLRIVERRVTGLGVKSRCLDSAVQVLDSGK